MTKAGAHALLLGLLLIVAGPAQAATSSDGRPTSDSEPPLTELESAGPVPDPSLSPGEIVRIQMTALQQNDASDNGIRTAFRFASPDNKRATGPFERFARMIKSAAYRPMLNARSIDFGPMAVNEGQAMQAVRVETEDAGSTTYIFILRRQTEAPYQDCWMTEAVFLPSEVDEEPDYEAGPPGVV